MSLGRTARRASPIASISSSNVRAADDRSQAFSLLKSRSIGSRSRIVGGQVADLRPGQADQPLDLGDLVARQVVHDDWK